MFNSGITASGRVAPIVTGGSLNSDNDYFYRTFTSNANLVIDKNAIEIEYLLVGGGGGPGGVKVQGPTTTSVLQGSGGAGGNVNLSSVKLLPGTYSVTIGAGGTGAIAGGTVAQQGGSTIIQGIATAVGGEGGITATGPSTRGKGGNNLSFLGGNVASTFLFLNNNYNIYGGAGGAGIQGNGFDSIAGTAGLGGDGTVIWGGTYSAGGRGGGQKTDGTYWGKTEYNQGSSTIVLSPNTGYGAYGSGLETVISNGTVSSLRSMPNTTSGASGIVIIRYKKTAL